MDNGDLEGGGGDLPFHGKGGGKYSPVVPHDRAVLEMSSMEPGSSSSDPKSSVKKNNVGTLGNLDSDGREGSNAENGGANGIYRENKLELFGFDSLVSILGLKSMTGEQIPAVSSPRDGEDVSITSGQPKPSDVKMGTMMGVFVPCLQSILGIIYYIRFSWIVGMGGIGESLLLVSLCGLCTFLTGISLSAIATNGAMKGGGPYYLIGRALGPEVGVSIGLCFFLGNAVAGALYVLGAVETFLKALPSAGIFSETTTKVNGTVSEPIQSISTHDLQIYGIVVTIILCFIVFGGVKMINRVAPAFLLPVLFSIFCIFIGIFTARKDDPSSGVTGLSIESFKDNWSSDYQNTNSAGIPDAEGDVHWNFHALVGLFFPAVTGIMAGSNRSASLKDTQRSIPIGTLAATLTTTGLYLVSVLLFGAVATRDKLLTDRLLTATIAWPFPAIIHIGIILSTLGAALQSLTGAPRLLAAISNDDILPVLNYFKVADGSEPYMATLFTAFICMGCVIIGNLDLITPTVTMFFLLCYSGVNLSCFLLDLLDAPSWRPRWKFHHWSFSLLGASLCIANQVHPKNWYPIPLVFCRPWGKLPENVPCHPKLADFANCMKKKGRGMSIFINILDGDYHERAEDAKAACKQLDNYINFKNCEGVAEIVVAPNMTEGFRGIVQTMGLGNLKPNVVVMRYPEIWRRENLQEIPAIFVGIINDCVVANKAVVIVKGLDEWPNEYQRQYGTIDLYWIVRDGGLMLLLSQLLLTKESFESCKIQVFCIAEEDTDAEGLKADVKKFLYDLRMQAEVIVITIKSWDVQLEGGSQPDESMEALTAAQKRVADYLAEIKETAKKEGTPLMADGKPVIVNEQQVEKFLYTTLKLNSTILKYSRMAAVVLVSLPPPPISHPAYCYMEYMDLLVDNVPRLLMVRGYRRDVVTLFT
ncbi:cation-chloride cotransporter 1-like isoform X2 [Hibiscus syriacus]|uniref:cation-chloride cotransporter 1-like isoform X2 n=1 Tax=Hibiscus syriacus TaxID=106335 RepID=UPI0019248B3F|nr:cation-chloride cotransporter 1-like isoform X2 [Hibiscus syriacus]